MATQPGTGLAIFDPKASAPAHVAHFFDDAGTNIAPRTTVPSLSPQGKMWTISINGQKIPLQRRNQDGDMEPLPIMKVVVLDYAKQRGRAYYEGAYDPNKEQAPICWSDDGVAPHSSLPGPFAAGTTIEPGTSRKISAACANCPMAIKGSKVQEGTNKAMVACAQHRMLAVIPDPALGLKDIPPLRLKIAITSDWDKQSPQEEQQGWLAFSLYTDWLLARGVKHTAALVTKMKFDPNAAYPKIFFSAERYLDANELAVIAPLSKSEEVTRLLGGTWTPAGVDGVPIDQQTVAQPQPSGEPPAQVPEPEYEMAPGEAFTREEYHAAGWTDQQLLDAKKMNPKGVLPLPAAPATLPAAAAPAQQTEAIVVGEPAATAAAPTAIVAEASPPATAAEAPQAIVIEEQAAPSPAATAPAEPPHQEPAQAQAPPPVATPPAPEPPAAAAKAAEVTPPVSTEVPSDVADLLKEWEG